MSGVGVQEPVHTEPQAAGAAAAGLDMLSAITGVRLPRDTKDVSAEAKGAHCSHSTSCVCLVSCVALSRYLRM